jgi:hypothetical protein
MSKPNKTNKSNYVQAGRLTPDDMARERAKMRTVRGDSDVVSGGGRTEGKPDPTERGGPAAPSRRRPRG